MLPTSAATAGCAAGSRPISSACPEAVSCTVSCISSVPSGPLSGMLSAGAVLSGSLSPSVTLSVNVPVSCFFPPVVNFRIRKTAAATASTARITGRTISSVSFVLRFPRLLLYFLSLMSIPLFWLNHALPVRPPFTSKPFLPTRETKTPVYGSCHKQRSLSKTVLSLKPISLTLHIFHHHIMDIA